MTKVLHADLWGERQKKSDWLNAHDVADTGWTHLEPKTPSYWFVPRDTELEAEYQTGWKITDAMPVNSVGMVTARDSLAIQFTESEMWNVVRTFAKMEPEKARSRFRLGADAQDWKVKMAQQDANDGGPHQKLVLPVLYRPFDTRYTYFTGRSRGFICRPRPEIMLQMVAGPNLAILFHRREEIQTLYKHFLCSERPTEHGALSSKTTNYQAPLYLYPSKSDQQIERSSMIDHYKAIASKSPTVTKTTRNDVVAELERILRDLFPARNFPRWPNLHPFFLDDIRKRLEMAFVPDGRGDMRQTFGPEDVFAYIYGVFHSPTYRTRYAEFLKIDFPRVPLTSNRELFRSLCEKGQELVDLHLMRDPRLASASFWGTSYPIAGKHEVTCVDYRPPGDMAPGEGQRLETGRVYINRAQPKRGVQAQYFEGVSPEVWEFRIGGYQVLHHWLKERKRHKRALTEDDIYHFQKVVAVLRETIRLMAEIDATIEAHGGWPDAFNGKAPAG